MASNFHQELKNKFSTKWAAKGWQSRKTVKTPGTSHDSKTHRTSFEVSKGVIFVESSWSLYQNMAAILEIFLLTRYDIMII